MIDRIYAIVIGLLPKRVWDDWDLPVDNMAFASALLTIFSGEALGDERQCDPKLTAVGSVIAGAPARHRDRAVHFARETLEGADEPDRLYDGEWTGAANATDVVVSARRKSEWTTGTWVITQDAARDDTT